MVTRAETPHNTSVCTDDNDTRYKSDTRRSQTPAPSVSHDETRIWKMANKGGQLPRSGCDDNSKGMASLLGGLHDVRIGRNIRDRRLTLCAKCEQHYATVRRKLERPRVYGVGLSLGAA